MRGFCQIAGNILPKLMVTGPYISTPVCQRKRAPKVSDGDPEKTLGRNTPTGR